ncbi:HAMP domain-containing histidine kinase [Rhodococcus triatomae]|nr:HAMP domain-containing sensor histidine kinase [Rhodococcus triatomae]QNG21119.1 HAMP domain-containing histidine kinase [Rhodococcus triatomae]QNG25589.1 HAMP domain-containing histidine kinase [Rhodococcus triatomae]
MPLRWSLVAVVVVLAAAGLAVSGVAVTSALDDSLTGRVDAQLQEATDGWARPRELPPPPPPGAGGPNPQRPPSLFFVQTTGPDGTEQQTFNDAESDPDVAGQTFGAPTTVESVDGSQRWRALTVVAPDGASTTVAMSLADNDQTVRRLVLLQAGVGVLVLLLLGGAAYAVVRRSLRPLADVEETAAAIAGGDLHRRIPERGVRTEVGRLSAALNGMLAQIQRAFAQTEASEEAARRSEENMRRFVADAGHELRTPLTTIRGFAELHRQGATTDSALVLARIEGEAQRMGLLVEDLLMLARLDAQRPIAQETVDLLGVCTDAVHAARATAPERSISLGVSQDVTRAEVVGDEARLRQVLGNLLANAIEHTPADADVMVRLETGERTAVIEVSDTGPGLDESEVGRVFERFYRADSSRSRSTGGSGLGLSIVAALVAAHGGSVTVRSRPGEGSVFRVELPFRGERPAPPA